MRKVRIVEPTSPMGTAKKKIAAYCRVSTDSTTQANSYEMQKQYFTHHFANSTTEELTEVYADIGSGTGTSGRPEFLRMLDDCRRGKIDRIVTKSLSRFARNTKDCITTLRDLKKLGVSVLFEKEGIDTARITDEIMITIMEGLAQEESASISRNVRWSIKRRMQNGTFGIARVPYGYIKVDGKLEIEEEKAAVVRRIFSLYLSGNGAMRIAVLLNEENIPSPTGIKWNNITIFKILKQEKYIGDIRWQKTYSVFMGKKWLINHGEQESYYIRDALPAIISRDDFMKAQELREKNAREPHQITESPFRGKTKCTCGRSYYLVVKGKKAIWECTGKYDLSRPCRNPTFQDCAYHAAWQKMCIKLRKHADEIIAPCIAQCELLEDNFLNNEISELEEQYEELTQRRYVLCSLCAEGCITRVKLMTLENDIDAELSVINRQLNALNAQYDETVGQLEALYKFIIKTTPERLASLILVNAVSDGKTVEFELLGGLKLKEVLE